MVTAQRLRLTFYHFFRISGTLCFGTTIGHHAGLESVEFWNCLAKETKRSRFHILLKIKQGNRGNSDCIPHSSIIIECCVY